MEKQIRCEIVHFLCHQFNQNKKTKKMRKIVLSLMMMLLMSASSFAQFAYIPQYWEGNLNYTDLTDPSNYTFVGITEKRINASDFSSDGSFIYAISADSLFSIDTADASSTFLDTLSLPNAIAIWTGMAMDPTTGTMYVAWTDGAVSKYYTLDVSTYDRTYIGSNSYGNGVVGIAFDDDGQMYAIYLGNLFYKIDKTNANGTFVSNLIAVPTSGSYHGLDYCSENQTMYMTTYNSTTMNNELQTIDLTSGVNTLVGNLVERGGTLAVKNRFEIDFSADNTDICEGSSVNFTDESIGAVTSWYWTFEGGNPATSTEQNPTVTYNNYGIYDVTLKITSVSDTLEMTKTDYITVNNFPLNQPDQPEGSTETCSNNDYDYTTHAVEGIATYEWAVTPQEAGVISGDDTVATFTASTGWSGEYYIKVRANNSCSTSSWSDSLLATMSKTPDQYEIFGGGGYCEGGQGSEIKLNGSETGVDYELYFDGISTGNIVSGTGDTISFGFITDLGYFTAVGFTTNCQDDMLGEVSVFLTPAPGTPGTPNGPDSVCNHDTTTYTTTGASNADTLIWNLDPGNAGTIEYVDSITVSVEWNNSFTGTANLTIHGQNECGDGPSSDALEITVIASPEPEVTGSSEVCVDETDDYSTIDNPGNSYNWYVEGGIIIEGSGTHEITVQWENPGNGLVVVTEGNGTCLTTSDTLYVVIDVCNSIEEVNGNNFSIFPNPVKNQLSVKIPAGFAGKIKIMDLLGKTSFISKEINMGSSLVNFNTGNLKSGVYYLQIHSVTGDVYIKKFIKE